MVKILRIASRKSPLALRQTEIFAQKLKQYWPNLNIEIIAMTTKVIEQRKIKCAQYWPLDEGETMQIDNDSFEIRNERVDDLDDYRVSRLILKHSPSGQSRTVVHCQFMSWPDHGVPKTASHILEFIQLVRKYQREGFYFYFPCLIVLIVESQYVYACTEFSRICSSLSWYICMFKFNFKNFFRIISTFLPCVFEPIKFFCGLVVQHIGTLSIYMFLISSQSHSFKIFCIFTRNMEFFSKIYFLFFSR